MVLSLNALLIMLCCDNTASVQYGMGWDTKRKILHLAPRFSGDQAL